MYINYKLLIYKSIMSNNVYIIKYKNNNLNYTHF